MSLRLYAGLSLGTLIAVCAFALPMLVHAQASDELKATIRSEIMSDPRSAALSEVEIDQMVELLSDAAAKQGITASQIIWRPTDTDGETFGTTALPEQQPVDFCEGTPLLLCTFDMAFGFLGPDTIIAYLLGLASMGLIGVLASMLHLRKYPPVTPQPMTTRVF